MKNYILVGLLLLATIELFAQKYITKSGEVSFFSETPIEKIEAKNNNAMAAFDASTQVIVVKILLKSFRFEKALMQEHFNENYVESDQFPNSTFKGKFIDEPNLDSNELQNLKVSGKINIHGVEKEISTTIMFQVIDGIVNVKGKFNVNPADFDIDIPSAVVEKISTNLLVSFIFNLKAI
jgi:polyisoprenoid-binding protein YceI